MLRRHLLKNLLETSTTKLNHKWTKGNAMQYVQSTFGTPDYSKHSGFSPVQLFELFWNDNLMEYLLDETKKYVLFKNNSDLSLNINDIKCAIGIRILSGYNEKPGKRFY